MWKTEINNEMFFGLVLTLGAFLLAMFLTPIYTYFAYKYKFWKKQKKTTADGGDLPVMTKLHAHKFKRHFPTMAGIIGVITVGVVTFACNWDRGQTWLPLFGFLGGSLVGLIDDMINVFGDGHGAAGLRQRLLTQSCLLKHFLQQCQFMGLRRLERNHPVPVHILRLLSGKVKLDVFAHGMANRGAAFVCAGLQQLGDQLRADHGAGGFLNHHQILAAVAGADVIQRIFQ